MSAVPGNVRIRIFLGCQGESERSYGTLLHRLIERERRLHIEAVLLQPGAGDPLATVERAIRILREKERVYGSSYALRAVLLDRDQWGICPERDRHTIPLAQTNKFILIWQTPCHEAFLLRHIKGQHSRRPSTTKDAMTRLKSHWADYEKGVPADYLATKISLNDVRRALGVETDLKKFCDAAHYFVESD